MLSAIDEILSSSPSPLPSDSSSDYKDDSDEIDAFDCPNACATGCNMPALMALVDCGINLIEAFCSLLNASAGGTMRFRWNIVGGVIMLRYTGMYSVARSLCIQTLPWYNRRLEISLRVQWAFAGKTTKEMERLLENRAYTKHNILPAPDSLPLEKPQIISLS
jgi:hypothetical protein